MALLYPVMQHEKEEVNHLGRIIKYHFVSDYEELNAKKAQGKNILQQMRTIMKDIKRDEQKRYAI